MFDEFGITTDAEYGAVIDLVLKNKNLLGIKAVRDEGDTFRFSTERVGYVTIWSDLKIDVDEAETVISVREQQSDFGLHDKLYELLFRGLSERVTLYDTDLETVIREVNV